MSRPCAASAPRRAWLGQIFTKAQNKIQDPAKLARLIEMVDDISWVTLDADTKGDIFEGILEKTPRTPIPAPANILLPAPSSRLWSSAPPPSPAKSIADPACGTGGFFLSAYDYLVKHYQLNRDQKAFLKNGTFHGHEIVARTRRLCRMNLFLHNIGEIDGNSLIESTDALIAQPAQSVDYVRAHPPFGKKTR